MLRRGCRHARSWGEILIRKLCKVFFCVVKEWTFTKIYLGRGQLTDLAVSLTNYQILIYRHNLNIRYIRYHLDIHIYNTLYYYNYMVQNSFIIQ